MRFCRLKFSRRALAEEKLHEWDSQRRRLASRELVLGWFEDSCYVKCEHLSSGLYPNFTFIFFIQKWRHVLSKLFFSENVKTICVIARQCSENCQHKQILFPLHFLKQRILLVWKKSKQHVFANQLLVFIQLNTFQQSWLLSIDQIETVHFILHDIWILIVSYMHCLNLNI